MPDSNLTAEASAAQEARVREQVNKNLAKGGNPPLTPLPPSPPPVVADPSKAIAEAQLKEEAVKKLNTENEGESRRFNKRVYSDKPQLLPVFGYPPANILEKTNQQMYNSFPVATFLPCKPNLSFGVEMFVLQDEWEEYVGLLGKHGYSLPNNGNDKGIRVAFLADNFPTDSFTNEYGENVLQGVTDSLSNITGTMSQLSGSTSGTEMLQKMMRLGAGAADPMVNMITGGKGKPATDTAESIISAGKAAFKSTAESLGSMGAAGAKLLTSFDRILGGARLDFPSLWKASAFQPSYSLTVRLFNPYPQSPEATRKYILGPLTALMLLACPRTIDGGTFTWPWFQQISCPGIFDLNPSMITNLTIIKGGDQQQISFQNSMGIVDVRIDIGSLYNTMVSSEQEDKVGGRPTVRKYIENMEKQKPDVYAIGPPGRSSGTVDKWNTTPVNITLSPKVPVKAEDISETRFIDGRYKKPRSDSPAATPPRTKTIAETLMDLLPKGFKIAVT